MQGAEGQARTPRTCCMQTPSAAGGGGGGGGRGGGGGGGGGGGAGRAGEHSALWPEQPPAYTPPPGTHPGPTGGGVGYPTGAHALRSAGGLGYSAGGYPAAMAEGAAAARQGDSAVQLMRRGYVKVNLVTTAVLMLTT